jgi:serine/threonine protein phosphatase PrpC
VSYQSAARTHVGSVRQRNEDAVLERPDVGLWAVADGAGGHQRGDYASSAIIAALRDLPPADSSLTFVQQLKTRLQQLNQQFRAEAALIGPDAIIGSTIVVLMICGRQSLCLWAGDSRFYRMRDGKLSQLSRDQSYVQNLIDRGEIAPQAAASHPLANIVCNLVGGAEELVLEERHDALEPGDLLLLCSDGLTRALTDPDIAEILGEASIAMAADLLIERALKCGARDNVSAITIQYSG